MSKDRFSKEKDSLKITYRGANGRTNVYGLEFRYYNIDILALEPKIDLYKKTEERLRVLDSLVDDKNKYIEIRKGFYQHIFLPLKVFFQNKNFLDDKWVVNYSGSEKDYEDLENNVLKANNIFFILENSTLGFDYQIMEVKWIKPIPGL